VLAGEGEELPRISRAGLAQGLDEALDHGREHLVHLEVHGRARQAGVTAVQNGRTELVQPADGSSEPSPDHRRGR
jgi:hypothetical protein